MVRISTLIVLLGSFLLQGLAEYKAPFCPECWRFLDARDVDSTGRCLVSGKAPVSVASVTEKWFWCRSHQAWHHRPCTKEPWGATSERSATALLVPAGSEALALRAFCPEDGLLAAPGMIGMKCAVCGRAMVRAETVERRWYWCSSGKAWATEPCPMNRVARCDRMRHGSVLACPWDPPIIGEISVADSGRSGLLVQPEWLSSHLDDVNLVVLHVGFDPMDPANAGRADYYDGHLPGARSVAWSEIAVPRDGVPDALPAADDLVLMLRSLGIGEEDRLVLYDTGRGREAARAWLALDYLGLGERASLLDGQWTGWKSRALPEARMPFDVEPSAFVPRVRPEILVSLAAMKDLSWLAQQPGCNVALIDARTADEFSGLRAGKGILRAGHIPGAGNLCWTETVGPADQPFFRPESDLRGMLESAGARPGRTIIVYGRTTVEASMLYFVAKLLGADARIYAGSYLEWSRHDEAPFRGDWARR